MLFSLEVLQAFQGDSLLLHAGTAGAPKLVLIDGGPSRTWTRSLRPRLDELRAQRAAGGALDIDLAMLSHVDDDHIHGLLHLATELVDLHDRSEALPYDVHTLWHNSFDDVLDNEADELGAAATAALEQPLDDPRAEEMRGATLAVVANIPQGRELRNRAKALNWRVNAPFDGPVMRPANGVRTIRLGDATALTVLCPHAMQLEGLRRKWDGWLRAHPEEQASPASVAPDSSPYNLSSIVVLVEQDGRRMLLTGDARSDHILAGLDAAGVAADGVTKVDILKLPHHGSIRNVKADFFERVQADHYVISANGHDDNPETETLDLILASRADDDFTIHLTNRAGVGDLEQRLDAFLAAKTRNFEMIFLAEADLSLRIDLAEPLP